MKELKKIFVLMGYTSSGKSTITEEVSRQLNIPILVTHTSRPKREGESDNAYHFVNNQFFDDNMDNFLEQRKYQVYDGSIWKYGLHKDELTNKPYSLLVIDRKGYETLCGTIGKDKLTSIFIHVNHKDLRQRHSLRGDNTDEFNRRLADDIERFKGFTSDYIVHNGNLQVAINEVKGIISEVMECDL